MKTPQTKIFGTNHFVSTDAAAQYYHTGDNSEKSILGTVLEVKEKIASGAIEIGMPPARADQTAILNRQEGRYYLHEDAPPVREIKVKNNPKVRLLSIIFDRPTKSLS
jgi:hypothetical protein